MGGKLLDQGVVKRVVEEGVAGEEAVVAVPVEVQGGHQAPCHKSPKSGNSSMESKIVPLWRHWTNPHKTLRRRI